MKRTSRARVFTDLGGVSMQVIRFLSVPSSVPRGVHPPQAARTAARTPAVVIGTEANGLGTVRSLGKAGVPVVAVDDDKRHPGMHSRYARPFLVSALSGPALVDGLLALRARLDDRPVLFMTCDTQVRTISEYRAQLEEAFRVRLPEHHCVCELLDKSSFQRLAEKHGFPVPRAVTLREEKDIARLAGLRFPAVVKPGTKELLITKRAPRARQVLSLEQAEAVCREILPAAPDLIVQEWIEGAESDVYFCLQYRGEDGATVSSFTGRKLRCWPPQLGDTASCMAAPEVDSVLAPLTKAFFDSIGFVGMCGMEFKRDRRSGKFFMVEPTIGRTDLQEEVASFYGINIPLAAYCYEVGLPLPTVARVRDPLIWRHPPNFWRSVLVTKSFRDQAPATARVKSACWRVDDPVPLVFFCFEWIRKAWRSEL